MLTTVVEGVLPGLRSLRAPLISGILWVLLGWLVFSDEIAKARESAVWWSQLEAMAASLGHLTLSAVVTILVFVVGAVLAPASHLIDGAVKALGGYVMRKWSWRRHVTRQRVAWSREVALSRARIGELSARIGDVPEGKRDQRRRELEGRRDALTATEQLLKRGRGPRVLGRLWIPETKQYRKVFGSPPATAEHGLEEELVLSAREQGRASFLSERSGPLLSANVDFEWKPVHQFAEDFKKEMDADSVEVLRSISGAEDLYLELDRQRAEREVRRSVAIPVLVGVLVVGVDSGTWWWVLLAILPLLLTLTSSDAGERTEVLRSMRVQGLRTPILEQAYQMGRREASDLIEAHAYHDV